jgi:hypothetical protein
MADFITRLAQRTLGVAPVVQPLIASTFAPEQTSQFIGLVWDEEISAPSDDSERAESPLTMKTPPSYAPKGLPEETATTRSEDQGLGVHITRPLASKSLNGPPKPRRPARSRPFEGGVASRQEDQSTALLAPQNQPQENPPDAAKRGSLAGEVASRQVGHRTLASSESLLSERQEPLIDNKQGAALAPVPSPDIRDSLDAQDDTLDSLVVPDRSAPPAAPLVAPSTVRPQPNSEVERGPREPQAAASEPSAPTIRVNIGRIEVKAHTPSPAPLTQRSKPARPSPKLSLDDYLNQRDRGQR